MSTELRNIWGKETLTGLYRGKKNYRFLAIHSEKNSLIEKMSNAKANILHFQHLP